MESETITAIPEASQSTANRVSAFESQTYSVDEAAQVLGVSTVTVYRLIIRRLLRPLPHLRHKRIPKRQVQAFLDGIPSIE